MQQLGFALPSLSAGGHDPVYPPSHPKSSPMVCAFRIVLFRIVHLYPDRVPSSPDCEYLLMQKKNAVHKLKKGGAAFFLTL